MPTLKHTAEAIDFKLDLIEKNKNLLPYPYPKASEFPAGLEDVGDGSILVLTNITTPKTVNLATCSLPAGKKYIISLRVTNLVDEAYNENHDVRIRYNTKIGSTNSTNSVDKSNPYRVIDLSNKTEAAAVTVDISIQTAPNTDLIVKPQIEEVQVLENGQEQASPSDWVPYMDKIGSYVDERFNSTNTKIRKLNQRVSSEFIEVNSDIITIKNSLNKVLAFMNLIEIVDNETSTI